MKEGSSVIPITLVRPSSSLASNPWADVKNFLEEVTLDCPAVGNFRSKYRYLVGGAAPFFVPQTDDFVVQVLDASLNGTNQKLFGWI